MASITLKKVYYHTDSGWVSKGTAYYNEYEIKWLDRSSTSYEVLYVVDIDIPEQQFLENIGINYQIRSAPANVAGAKGYLYAYSVDPRTTDPSVEQIIGNSVTPVVTPGKTITKNGAFNLWHDFYGPRTAYILVNTGDYPDTQYMYFMLKSLSVRSQNPDLSIEVSPSSAIAGDAVSVISTGRAGQKLNLTLSANSVDLLTTTMTADSKSITTKYAWFDTAAVTGNSMTVTATATDPSDGRTATATFTLTRPQPLSVTAVAPKSVVKDGGQAITFSWTTSGTYGTQASASLQYSRDNATWYSLGSVTGDATTFTKEAGFFKRTGTCYWRVRVKSTYGVWSNYANATFTTQINAPTVTLTSPATGNIDISTAIQFKWTLTAGSGSITGTQMETSVDNGTTWVKRVDSTSSVTKFNATAGMFPTGKVLWRVRAKDEYAGWSAWQQSNVTITAVLPVVTLTTPTSGTKDGGTAIAFNWTIAAGSGSITGTQLYYSVDDGVNWTALVNKSESVVTYTAAAGKFPAGSLKWRVRVRDQYTGWLDTWKTATITVSYSAPTVTLTSPTSGSFDLGTSIKFVWTIAKGSGSISGTQMETSSDDGVTWVNRLDSTKSSTSFTAAAGTFTTGSLKWRVRAKDQYTQSGQSGWGEWKQATITITKTLPVVTLISPTSGRREGGQAIQFTWSLTNGSGTITSVGFYTSEDDGATWTKRLGKSGQPTSYTVTAGTLAPGPLKWRVRANDSLGGMSNWATASITIEYSATSYVAPLNSPTGGNVDASEPITFSGTLLSNGVPYEPFTMAAATFYWRSNSSDPYTSVQMTPDGANASVTIPAGTFPSGTVYWYIEATDNTGASTQTDVYTISTLASRIDASPVSPVSVIETKNTPTTFKWRYATVTGSKQKAAELEYSIDGGASWLTLGSVTGTATSYIAPANALPSGTITWRVRAQNTANEWGEWSAPVNFVNFGAPDVFSVVTDGKPYTTITWQVNTQESYKLFVDGVQIGPYHGEDVRTYTLTQPLADGQHTVQVQVQNEYSQWSPINGTVFDVTNTPTASVALNGSADVDVTLNWSGGDGTGDWFIYRDGVPIGHTGQTQFVDRVVIGSHEYFVIEKLATGYYNKSNTVTAEPDVDCPMIAPLAGGEWLPLALSLDADRVIQISDEISTAERYVLGADYPVVTIGRHRARRVNLDAAWLRSSLSNDAFIALFGKPVILKLPINGVIIGVLPAYAQSNARFASGYTYSISQADWRDFIDDT